MKWSTVAMLVAAVVVLVAGLRLAERHPEAGPVLERLWLGVEEPEPTEGFTIRCDGEHVFLAQGEQEQVMGDVTKTQIFDGTAHISGTLGMMNLQDYAFISLATKQVIIRVGSVTCEIRDISTEGTWHESFAWDEDFGIEYVAPEAGHSYVVVVFMYATNFTAANEVCTQPEYYYYDPGTSEEPMHVEAPFDFSITGRQRACQETVTPTGERDVGPAYSSEVHYADSELTLEPLSWTITFNGYTFSGTQVFSGDEYKPFIYPVGGWTFIENAHHANADVLYANLEVAWDGVDMDLSRYYKTSGLSLRYIEGVDGGVEVYGKTGTGAEGHSISCGRPLGADYSDFSIEDPFGNEVGDDLVLAGNVQASNHLGASLGWSTTPDGLTKTGADPGDAVYPTVAELRAVGEYVDPPAITGLDYRDPDDSYGFFTSATHQWALTEEGVQATGETVGHESDDLLISLRLPGVDATDLRASPDRPVVTITHLEQAGVYGPGPALTDADWQGAGGVTSTDAGGAFTAEGDGSLALPVPSNLNTFLDMIPEQNFPTGMVGLPLIGCYHRADALREYDGKLDQGGNPFSVPLEGRYCGRGWPCLRLSFPTAAAQDTLTVTLTVLTHRYSDGHWTSSKRQTGTDEQPYEHTATEHTYTYKTALTNGVGYIYLALPQENDDEEPDLEQVTEIKIEGFSDGEWEIAEPFWCLDPDDTVGADAIKLKVFEGRDYRSGGLTARAESVTQYALCDTMDDNGGHENLVEWPVVRMWDYLISDPDSAVQLDLTAAYELGGWLVYVENLSDAWETDFDSDEWDAMTLDEDGNRLCTGRAFNFRGPLDGESRLIQTAGAGLNGALVGRSLTAVAGYVYPIMPDKVIYGASCGPMTTGGRRLARNEAMESIWRQPEDSDPEEWAKYTTPGSNSAGLWTSIAGAVYHAYAPAPVLWDYGKGTAGDVQPTGRWAAREFDFYWLFSDHGYPVIMWHGPEGEEHVYGFRSQVSHAFLRRSSLEAPYIRVYSGRADRIWALARRRSISPEHVLCVQEDESDIKLLLATDGGGAFSEVAAGGELWSAVTQPTLIALWEGWIENEVWRIVRRESGMVMQGFKISGGGLDVLGEGAMLTTAEVAVTALERAVYAAQYPPARWAEVIGEAVGGGIVYLKADLRGVWSETPLQETGSAWDDATVASAVRHAFGDLLVLATDDDGLPYVLRATPRGQVLEWQEPVAMTMVEGDEVPTLDPEKVAMSAAPGNRLELVGWTGGEWVRLVSLNNGGTWSRIGALTLEDCTVT